MDFVHNTTPTDDGNTLAYKSIGSGPTDIILMPGWGSTKDYFDETIAAMSTDDVRITAYDPRGHGDSPEGVDLYDSERQARDMLAIADAIGAQTFVAGGHSMGAKYIQQLPILAPGRAIGLFLIAGCPAGAMEVPAEVIDEWAGFSGSEEAMLKSHRSIITQPIPEAVSNKWAKQASEISQPVLHKTLSHCFFDDFEAALGSVRFPPTFVLGATADPFFPVEMMKERVTAKIPGAREAYVDCGHEIPNELPHIKAATLEAFVAGLASN